MRLVHNIAELRSLLSGCTHTSFVPTMGNLHEGHIALVERAKTLGNPVVTSIFVNPLQFGAEEDFECYPRTLEADRERLTVAGCDLVFAPDAHEMFPKPQGFHVQPPPIANDLEGRSRPGHFSGVATIVLKLFNMVQPEVAVFGKKDYQQLHIIRAMISQLNLPIVVEACETVRAPDGLALSSRNAYLTQDERAEAPSLYHQLQLSRQDILAGNDNYGEMESRACAELTLRGWVVDYVAIRSRDDLLPPRNGCDRLVVLGAARLGATRLIDNLEICLPEATAL
jgi:pantoate--beta-alanine ligase